MNTATTGKQLTIEHGFWLAIFLLGLMVRLIGLGNNPPGDVEAGWALQALGVARGEQAVLVDVQPGYVVLTGGLFYVFGATDFLARLIPALSGSLLVLSPLLFKQLLGRRLALLLGVGLAISPTLVAASRLAGSPMMAVAFAALTVGYLVRRNAVGAGICAGLAVLGGASLWAGILIAALTILLVRVLKIKLTAKMWLPETFLWKVAAGFFAGTVILVGTLFFFIPIGINAAAAGLPEYIQGWGRAGAGVGQLILALVFYEPLALLLSLFFCISTLMGGNAIDKALVLSGLVAMLVSILYPARQAVDLAWVLLPILVMAARQADRLLSMRVDNSGAMIAQTGLIVTSLTSIWLFVLYSQTNIIPPGDVEYQARLITVIAVALVLVLGTVLIGYGWSWKSMLKGCMLGSGGVLLAFTLAAMWHAGGLGSHPEAEMYRVDDYPAEARGMVRTIEDLSRWKVGINQRMEVTIIGDDIPSLHWALRDHPVVAVPFLPAGKNPDLVITTNEFDFGQTMEYRGQDFVWRLKPAWSLYVTEEWVRWIQTRAVPMQKEYIYLWARSDVFPGAGKE